MLLKDMLGIVVPIFCKIDNTQAILAIKNGYSKKLRYLPRTQRVSIGALNEIWRDPAVALEVEYVQSAEHKGDFFTKELGAAMFKEARERVGMRGRMA